MYIKKAFKLKNLAFNHSYSRAAVYKVHLHV